MKLTRTFYIASVAWVICGSVVGVYFYDRWASHDEKEALAPLALTTRCGPDGLLTDKEVADQATQWLVNQAATPIDLQKTLLRNLAALPSAAAKTLRYNGIRFAVDTGQAPYTCSSQNAPRIPSGVSCVKATQKDGLFVVLNYSQGLSPDGQSLNISPSEKIEPVVLPISFWVLFQGVWRLDNPKPPRDEEVSVSNRLLTLKKYVISGYKFSSEEDDYYHKYYSASGRYSPSFLTRSLILTASTTYCSKQSYENLFNQAPEAVRRFWAVYGCALGRPWHMTADEYEKICSPSLNL